MVEKWSFGARQRPMKCPLVDRKIMFLYEVVGIAYIVISLATGICLVAKHGWRVF